MSTALQSYSSDNTVDEILQDLDTRAKDISQVSAEWLATGPFSVFRFNCTRREAQPRVEAVEPTVGDTTEEVPTNELVDTMPTVGSVDSLDRMVDFLDWPDLFDLDAFSSSAMPYSLDFYDPSLNRLPEQGSLEWALTSEGSSNPLLTSSSQGPHDDTRQTHSAAEHARSYAPALDNINPLDAQLLLKHFRDKVITQMAPLPLKGKSPWEFNNLNSAVLTLSGITYMTGRTISQAAMANFWALLGISAHHLAAQNAREVGDTPVAYWQGLAATAIHQAKESMKWSLSNESRGPGTAKYKDQLMAINSLLAFAVLYDRQREARAYMIDTERLLRQRGLAKRTISRKARWLHHIYTWLRIIGESTYVLRNYKNIEQGQQVVTRSHAHRQRQNTTLPGSMPTPPPLPNPRLDDFLRLQAQDTDSDPDTVALKDRDVGLQDIHLEDSREWPETLYMQLYGMSETWLSLVSQTTRLANVMDRLAANKGQNDLESFESLERRKERLENMVCSFAANNVSSEADAAADIQSQSLSHPRMYIARALYSALVIFFYRRVRKANPLILQNHVNSVIQALKSFQDSCHIYNIEVSGSPWPAFMAGCEALQQEQMDFFSSWFDHAYASTGFTTHATAKACMLEVWNRRQNLQQRRQGRQQSQVQTWVHVCKEQNITLLLS